MFYYSCLNNDKKSLSRIAPSPTGPFVNGVVVVGYILLTAVSFSSSGSYSNSLISFNGLGI
jgi:hypothetical protein